MYATIQAWDGGQGLRIPSALLEALGLRENDRVELIQSENAITIRKSEQPNAETLAALEEVRDMEANPERYKSYNSFGELLAEVLTDA